MKKDAQGNIIPDKAKSHEKIDGISGIVMALGVEMLPNPNEQKPSIYEDRDLLILGEDEPLPEEKPQPISIVIRKPPVGWVRRQLSVPQAATIQS